MSFLTGRGWPHVSQVFCDTPPFLGKDIPMLSFLFCALGGSGVEEGLDATDAFLGSLEPNVSSDEISQ